jgi:hypothetical protein
MMQMRGNDTKTLEPNLTIYLDADGALLNQIKIPDNVTVTTTVDIPGLKAKRTLPERRNYFGRIQFDDGDPANGMEKGISTQISFWEKDVADAVPLAKVDREGQFKVVLSDQELAAINKGDAWLTITTGNFITKPSAENMKFPPASLTQEKEKVQPIKIAAPTYFYGRILFNDDTPPVLAPPPWQGSQINVSFPYAGQAHLDAEGYFQVYFEPSQLQELLKRKPQKNIYIPDKEQGRATAREIYPPQLLSQDKSKAGVVKIPKPDYANSK